MESLAIGHVECRLLDFEYYRSSFGSMLFSNSTLADEGFRIRIAGLCFIYIYIFLTQ